ncbi:MAG: hypothetical protein ABJH08_03320 [Balneola sp.]
MLNKYKALLSFLLIISSMLLLVKYYVQKPSVITHGNKLSLSLNDEENSFNSIINNNSEKNFSVFFFIDSKPCSPCINNISDYLSLFKERDIQTHAIFSDKEKGEIDRFFRIVGFDMGWSILNSENIPVYFRSNENMFFIYNSISKSFVYSLELSSNNTTTLEYKEEILKEALD